MPRTTLLFCLLLPLLPRVSQAQGPPTDPVIGEAGALLGQGKFDEALARLEEVLARDPHEPWAWYQVGLAHHHAGRLDEALKGHLVALAHAAPRGRLRATASYNVACVHALQGRPEYALQWLHRARNAGFQDAQGLAGDADLKGLLEDPRLVALQASLSITAVEGVAVSTVGEEHAGGTGGVACAPDGTVFVADFGSNVYRVGPSGKPELFAEGFTKAAGCLVEPDGSLLQVDFDGKRVWRISPEGEQQDLGLEGLLGPVGVARAQDGTLFLTDFRQRAVLRVRPGEQPETMVAGGLLKGPNGICLAPTGDLYVCNYDDGGVLRVTQEGALSFAAELPGGGNGHLVWRGGALYVTARAGHGVYRVTPEGVVAKVSGDGSRGRLDGEGASTRHALPNGIALGPDGRTLFVNDQVTAGRFALRAIRLPE